MVMAEPVPLHAVESVYAQRLRELTRQDWQLLKGALERVQTAESFGHWVPSVRLADASWQMPYAVLSSDVEELMRTWGALGLYIPFEWPAWAAGRALARDPGELEVATPAEAAMLIVAVVRSNRFIEGELLESFENGLIQRAVRRVLSAERGES